MRILITGGLGLIGKCLSQSLRQAGVDVEILDKRGTPTSGTLGDVCNVGQLRSRMARCAGVVHLAAVSRVIWGERDPATCWEVNVKGTQNVLAAAFEQSRNGRPWVISASSREVYGQPDRLPVQEDASLSPINVYGRSKAAAEGLLAAARDAGLRTAVVRFSNVFGDIDDHPDRVVPAFSRAAANGDSMRVDGKDNVFDFTWLADVCGGLTTLCHMMREAEGPPPIHFVSGRATSLMELAQLARRAAGGSSSVVLSPPRSFDVDRFVGDPRRAEQLLGWRAETTVEQGVSRLVHAFIAERARTVLPHPHLPEPAGAPIGPVDTTAQ